MTDFMNIITMLSNSYMYLVPSVMMSFQESVDLKFVLDDLLHWKVAFHFQNHWEMSFEDGMFSGL